MSDLELIKQIEKQIKSFKIIKKVNNLLLRPEKCNCVINEQNKIIGLKLHDSRFRDISILSQCTQLQKLSLRNNEITNIDALQYLKNLWYLDLNNNHITNISSLTNLNNLTQLHLAHNRISELCSLKNIKNLTHLDLSDNGIIRLDSLSELKLLIKLYLSNNKISSITALEYMRNLSLLDLSDNKISELPAWILNFNLDIKYKTEKIKKGVYLLNNPVETPPYEIVNQGNIAIKAYFDSMTGQKRRLNELKVLFVGDGGAGKTSLSKLLRDQTFDPHENQTHGINIDDWKVGDITAHLWDFGGQEIMRATHKFFLSKRSLYVLVLDNREERDEERWLKRIESFGGNSPILIVLNKCEQNASYDVDRRDLVRRYSGLQTQDFYFVSCANGQGMEAFKQGLIAAFKRVELINSVLPESWFQVKTALEQQQRQQHYISYDRYIEICQQQQIADTQTQDILARLLHDLGVSVHFEDLALLDTHVLEPKWITEGVYKIITSPQLTEQQGVLYEADLPELLKKQTEDDYYYPPNKYSYLLELMKKFELSYHLNGNSNAVLIPQLLKPEEPEFTFDDSGQVLRFQILYDYLDDSIMPRFIVALHQDIDNRIQWRKGVLLKNSNFKSQAVVRVNYQDRLLTIVVKGEQKRDYFAVIRKALQDIHASFEWKKPPVELVPLPDNPEFTVEYEELIGYEQMGKDDYPVGKLRKVYSVSELLNGIERPEQRKQGGENHYHFYKGDNVQEKKVAEINQNVEKKLTPELVKFYEILKKIHQSFGRCWFVLTTTSGYEMETFQETVCYLKEAKERGYISDLVVTPGNQNVNYMAIQAFIDSGLTLKGRDIIKYPEKLIIDNNPQAAIDMSTTTINQNVTNSTIHGSVLAAKTIENCLNTVQTSQADNGIKELLTDLLKQISELNSKVPAEKIQVVENMSRDAKSLVEEVSSNQPRKRNALFSLEGMKDAAIQLGETAAPIITIAEKISPFLQSLI